MSILTAGVQQNSLVAWARRAVQVALLLVAGWLLVKLLLLLTGANRLALHTELPAPPLLQARERWAWFAQTAAPEVQGNYGELRDASVKAELLGVVISKAGSMATMSLGGRPEVNYRVGDKLGGGVEIRDIEPFRVVVWQNGQLRQIPLNRAGGGQEGAVARPVLGSSSGHTAGKSFSMPGMFAANPVSVENFEAGYQLRNLSSAFTEVADLRENDVVVMVNGINIEDMVANPSSWTALMQETSVPVLVLRDGLETEVMVDAASLSTRLMPKLDSRLTQ